jgi:hypothetical protein
MDEVGTSAIHVGDESVVNERLRRQAAELQCQVCHVNGNQNNLQSWCWTIMGLHVVRLLLIS